jgi:glycosyltransferase involved in cell wall biosynthesis
MWPDIKQRYPDAQLHVTYGWDLFDKVASGNPERMQWKKSVNTLLNQPDIFHYGRIGKEELKKIRQSCGIWAYPTAFHEINCITALDCQADGLVPVTMALAALKETAKEGILVEGDITNVRIQQNFLKELFLLMDDEERWKKLSHKCRQFTNAYDWSTIADQWLEYFKEPLSQPKVSIITPTIREGWWRIMAENLASQTYKYFEWIIVDDYKKNREETARKYAERFGLPIHYLRGASSAKESPPFFPRRCGLVHANNIGWQNAIGELLVWLQDFILIPNNGIEQLVDLYRHNPDALIAPVDIRYNSVEPNQNNKDDWWDGQEKVIAEEDWRNIRVQNLGIRESDNPFDFETNYGAIPKHILDELNGFWEFFDDGLGYDNTEICYRALKLGYRLLIDDTNIAKCINLWPHIKGTPQNITDRERILNTPRWFWFINQMKSGKLLPKRDISLDNSIHLDFEVPKEIEDKDCAEWIKEHAEKIVRG